MYCWNISPSRAYFGLFIRCPSSVGSSLLFSILRLGQASAYFYIEPNLDLDSKRSFQFSLFLSNVDEIYNSAKFAYFVQWRNVLWYFDMANRKLFKQALDEVGRQSKNASYTASHGSNLTAGRTHPKLFQLTCCSKIVLIVILGSWVWFPSFFKSNQLTSQKLDWNPLALQRVVLQSASV